MVDFNIDKKIWKEYQILCIHLNESASKRIEKFMKEELEKNKKKFS